MFNPSDFHTALITAMEKNQGQNNHLCINDALRMSPRKKIKLENDERIKEEEDEEEDSILTEFSNPVPWQKVEAEGLDLDYALLFSKAEADHLFKQLEEEVVYSTGITLFCKITTVHCSAVEW